MGGEGGTFADVVLWLASCGCPWARFILMGAPFAFCGFPAREAKARTFTSSVGHTAGHLRGQLTYSNSGFSSANLYADVSTRFHCCHSLTCELQRWRGREGRGSVHGRGHRRREASAGQCMGHQVLWKFGLPDLAPKDYDTVPNPPYCQQPADGPQWLKSKDVRMALADCFGPFRLVLVHCSLIGFRGTCLRPGEVQPALALS